MQEDNMLDLFDEVASDVSVPNDEALGRVEKLARRQIELEDSVSSLGEKLKQAEKDLEQVSRVDIPDLLDEIGMLNFTLKDGAAIKVEDKLKASIPKGTTPETEEKARKAFAWLRDHNAGALIKTVISVVIPKGGARDKVERKLLDLLDAACLVDRDEWLAYNTDGTRQLNETWGVLFAHLGLFHEEAEQVPWNTLTKYVKERKEANQPIDADLLGVFEYRETKITRSK